MIRKSIYDVQTTFTTYYFITFSPAPQTSTLLPMEIPALRHACTATDRGSRRAPSSNETWSGSLNRQISQLSQ